MRSLFLLVAVLGACFAGVRWLDENRPWNKYPPELYSVDYHSGRFVDGNYIRLTIDGDGSVAYYFGMNDGKLNRRPVFFLETEISKREAAEIIEQAIAFYQKDALQPAQGATPECTVTLPTGFSIGGAFHNVKGLNRENAIGGSDLQRRLRLICQMCDPERWDDGDVPP
jgi:hypothetical protein